MSDSKWEFAAWIYLAISFVLMVYLALLKTAFPLPAILAAVAWDGQWTDDAVLRFVVRAVMLAISAAFAPGVIAAALGMLAFSLGVWALMGAVSALGYLWSLSPTGAFVAGAIGVVIAGMLLRAALAPLQRRAAAAMRQHADERAARAAAEAADLARAAEAAATRARTERELYQQRHDIETAITNSQRLLAVADEDLKTAEREFRGRFFDPFWDAIQSATANLARLEGEVVGGRNRVQRIVDGSRSIKVDASQFVPTTHWPDPSATLRVLHGLIRQSQRDVEFTQIFHMRRTNQILVEGFTTLSDTLSILNGRLGEAFSVLARGIDDMRDTLDASVSHGFEALGSNVTEVAEAIREEATARREA